MEEITKVAKRDDVNPNEGEHKYGDVEFADEKNKKYPIDTKEHVQAALRYIRMPKNRKKYDGEDLKAIELRIHQAAHKFGIDEEEKKKSTDFSFFANLVKAYTDEDGNSYIVGEATGPELDQDGEKMAKSAIDCMMKAIHDKIVDEDGSLVNVPLNDAHYHDGVLKELGQIVSAELTDKYHLLIKAILDMDNPAAGSLVKQLRKGKQFGLSVAGFINDAKYVWDEAVQRSVQQFTDVDLREISVTSRPSWSESYVSVLTKSAKSYLTEQNTMDTQETLPETSKAEVTQETKNLVETKEITKSENAKDAVEKAKDAVKPKHIEIMRKKVAHLHDHLQGMARGESDPDEELDHVVAHAKAVASTLGKMSKGDSSDFDGIDLDDVVQAPYFMLSHQDEAIGKVEKANSDAEPLEPTEVIPEETSQVEEAKAEAAPEAPAENAVVEENSAEEVAPDAIAEEAPIEEAKAEEVPNTEEKSAKEEVDVEKLVKSAIDRVSESYLTQIRELRAEVEDLKKTPNEPKGKVNAPDASKVVGETQNKGKEAAEAYAKSTTSPDLKRYWRIYNNVEEFKAS